MTSRDEFMRTVVAVQALCEDLHLAFRFALPPLWPMTLELADVSAATAPFVSVSTLRDAEEAVRGQHVHVRMAHLDPTLLAVLNQGSASYQLRRLSISDRLPNSAVAVPHVLNDADEVLVASPIRAVHVDRVVDLVRLALLPQLREVHVSHVAIYSLAPLAAAQQLRFVSATMVPLGDESVVALARLPRLDALELAHCSGGTTLSPLAACTTLTRLECRGCARLWDAGLMGLETLPYLRKLVLESSPSITTVNQFERARSLEWISLCFTGITTSGIEKLSYCPNLQRLDVVGCEGVPQPLTVAPCNDERPCVELPAVDAVRKTNRSHAAIAAVATLQFLLASAFLIPYLLKEL